MHLECMSEMRCTLLAENTGRKKSPRHSYADTDGDIREVRMSRSLEAEIDFSSADQMKLGTQVSLGPGHIVLDGNPGPPPPK